MPSSGPGYKKRRLIERGIDPRLYAAWDNMKCRCKPTHKVHKDYADRGISVCTAWRSFEIFAEDVGAHPGPGWTLDRKNNDLGYHVGNVRWATSKTQANNRREAVNSKLSPAAVRAIRAAKTSRVTLSKKYGVSLSMITHIKNGTRREGVER